MHRTIPPPGEGVPEGQGWNAGDRCTFTALLQAFYHVMVHAIPLPSASLTPSPRERVLGACHISNSSINWNLKIGKCESLGRNRSRLLFVKAVDPVCLQKINQENNAAQCPGDGVCPGNGGQLLMEPDCHGDIRHPEYTPMAYLKN